MAVTIRASSAAGNTTDPLSTGTGVLNFGSTIQAGDTMVVAFGYARSSDVVTSVQDNNGNNFTRLVFVVNAPAFVTTQIWYCYLASGTATSVTVSMSNNSGAASFMWGAGFTGIDSSSAAGNTTTDISDTGASQITPSISSGTPNDGLFIAAMQGDANRTWDADVSTFPYTTGIHGNTTFFTAGADYRIVSATETNNHGVTLSAGSNTAHILGVLHGTASATVNTNMLPGISF